jgi:hypothetical protein
MVESFCWRASMRFFQFYVLLQQGFGIGLLLRIDLLCVRLNKMGR